MLMEINLIFAVFKSRQLEKNYKKHYLNHDKNQAAIIIRFLALTVLLFGYFDFHLFGLTHAAFCLIAIRAFLALASLLTTFYINGIQAYSRLESTVLSYSLFFIIFIFLIMGFDPGYYLQYPVIPAFILILFYILFPNTLKLQIIPPLAFTLIYLCFIFIYKVFDDTLGLIVSVTACIICNLAGFYIIRRMHIYRRIQFNLLENEKRISQKLKKANDNIKQISGLLPICCNCKKIRNDKGYWEQLESFIETHSGAKFNHSLCSECSRDLYKNNPWYKKNK